jgi:hypothetical protein
MGGEACESVGIWLDFSFPTDWIIDPPVTDLPGCFFIT